MLRPCNLHLYDRSHDHSPVAAIASKARCIFNLYAIGSRRLLSSCPLACASFSVFLVQGLKLQTAAAKLHCSASADNSIPPQIWKLCGVPASLQGVQLAPVSDALQRLSDVCCPLEVVTRLQEADDAIIHAVHEVRSVWGSKFGAQSHRSVYDPRMSPIHRCCKINSSTIQCYVQQQQELLPEHIGYMTRFVASYCAFIMASSSGLGLTGLDLCLFVV